MQSSTVLVRPPPPPLLPFTAGGETSTVTVDRTRSCVVLSEFAAYVSQTGCILLFSNKVGNSHTLTVIHTHTHPTHMMGARGDGKGEGTGVGWGGGGGQKEKVRKGQKTKHDHKNSCSVRELPFIAVVLRTSAGNKAGGTQRPPNGHRAPIDVGKAAAGRGEQPHPALISPRAGRHVAWRSGPERPGIAGPWLRQAWTLA